MKKMPGILFTLLITALLITSCATLTDDIKIETHADNSINFNAYKTYAWAESAQIVFDPVGQWEQPTLDTDEEVRFSINREMRSRNFTQVDNDPDLLVTFAAGIDHAALKIKENPDSNNNTLARTPKTALTIAFIDARTGYAVWQGYAMGDAQEQQSIENIRERINYAVREIFKSYNR